MKERLWKGDWTNTVAEQRCFWTDGNDGINFDYVEEQTEDDGQDSARLRAALPPS